MKKYLVILIIPIIFLFWLFDKDVSATQTSSIVTDGFSVSVRIPTQGSNFYAAGRYWVFYLDGADDFGFKTSTDGETWSATTTIQDGDNSVNAAMQDVYFDGVNVHYIRNDHFQSRNYDMLIYRKGVPETDGTITWAAAEQTILSDGYHANDISLTVDSTGHPWIGMQYGTTSSYGNAYVTTASTTDGTWVTATGYPKELYATPADTWLTKVVALDNGKIYAIIYVTNGIKGDYPIYGYAYNGEEWGSRERITGSDMKNSATGGTFGQSDAISIGDDIHLVFQAATSSDIRYVKYTEGAWTQEEILVATADRSDKSSPVLTKWDADTIYMFWMSLPSIYYLINDAGTWQTNPNVFLSDFHIVVDVERNIQVFKESYSSLGGLLYLPVIDSVYQQTFVSYTDLDPPGAVAPPVIPTQFKNKVIFKNGVHIKD